MADKPEQVDPFGDSTPYDVLGIDKGPSATGRDVTRAYTEAKRKARRISDVKQRAARMKELDRAKEQLQRPGDRVLVDFFMLSEDTFGDLCIRVAKSMTELQMPTDEVLGPLLSKRYDDLLPASREQFRREFHLLENMEFFDAADLEEARLPIVTL
jgi:hypothetical protein